MALRSETVAAVAAVILAAAIGRPPAHASGQRDAAALAAMQQLAAGRQGHVVWQSRRSGPLRIWACDLDGSNLRQISSDVAGRDHMAPLISPDGKSVIYYQTYAVSDADYYDDHYGEMWIVDIDDAGQGQSARMLQQDVRTYFECRFARWLDNDRVAYIGQDHHGHVYSLASGATGKLFDYSEADFGAIPNRQLTHAIDGKNRVYEIINAGPGGALDAKQDYDGCEGNMTADGLWAYRVQGTDHDFVRMRLGSWEEETFFANHDAALPAAQAYIYFPQVSACQRFLALGASADAHNHFESDYDIFVVPIDPQTLSKTGPAVKYSFSDALDSYPDIWVEPDSRELATIEVTAASASIAPGASVQLTARPLDQLGDPVAAQLAWSVSGGGTVAPQSSGGAVQESVATFTSDGSPGSFTVSARADGIEGRAVIAVGQQRVVLRINCGDNAHDVPGWERDDAYVTGGEDWTNPNAVDTTGVEDAAPAEVYRSVRHLGPHSYNLPLDDGDYLLRLHFADAYGDRSMTYRIEGQVSLTAFDPVTRAGAKNRACVETIPVTVTGGDGLQIEATAEADGDVFEAGLEIVVPAAPPAGDGATTGDGGPAGDGGPTDGSGDGSAGDGAGLQGGCGSCATADVVNADQAGLLVLLSALLLALRQDRTGVDFRPHRARPHPGLISALRQDRTGVDLARPHRFGKTAPGLIWPPATGPPGKTAPGLISRPDRGKTAPGVISDATFAPCSR